MSLLQSGYQGKDFTTPAGVLATLEYETLMQGQIRRTWLEYIEAALPRINEQYAKELRPTSHPLTHERNEIMSLFL